MTDKIKRPTTTKGLPMRKLSIIFTLLFSTSIYAQNTVNALRTLYPWEFNAGMCIGALSIMNISGGKITNLTPQSMNEAKRVWVKYQPLFLSSDSIVTQCLQRGATDGGGLESAKSCLINKISTKNDLAFVTGVLIGRNGLAVKVDGGATASALEWTTSGICNPS
jgi:hypothetical protein